MFTLILDCPLSGIYFRAFFLNVSLFYVLTLFLSIHIFSYILDIWHMAVNVQRESRAENYLSGNTGMCKKEENLTSGKNGVRTTLELARPESFQK